MARRTREAALLAEAAGFDVVMIETVGVGQSEVAVSDMVDLFAVLVAPGGGDELQGIKRGIMELADLVVVNKDDGDLAPAAGRIAAEYQHALSLLRPRWRSWQPKVVTCSAAERRGITEVWAAVCQFREAVTTSGELADNRRAQAVAWMWSELRDALLDRLRSDAAAGEELATVESLVRAGELSPASAAARVLDAFEGRR